MFGKTMAAAALFAFATVSLAGYVSAASGRTFVTVVILNHPLASQGAGEALQTALVEWVFGQ